MPAEEITKLIDLYLKQRCSPAQKEQVENWFEQYQLTNKEFYNQDEELIRASSERSILRLREKIREKETNFGIFNFWKAGLAAAVLFVLFTAGLLTYWSERTTVGTANIYVNDIPPGTNQAILTLTDGSKILLDEKSEGKALPLLKAKHEEGLLAYNTITIPRGGQYQLMLPDGTTVWLNASSSLKFPSNFRHEKQRKVLLTGEGYFEVAKNPAMPFLVKSGKQEIRVLGTHFNVSAYADENAITTTLLEGKVLINETTNLSPGDQSVNDGSAIAVRQVDPELATAWKNGKFKFRNENIKDLMNKISKWYNVEVIYEGKMTNKDFSGSVSRFDYVSKILDVLQSTNTVHFKVEGRRITVMP